MVIKTVRQLVAALGGDHAVRSLFDMEMAPNVIAMWCTRERAPPRSYVVMTHRLRQLGHSAPPGLWGMYPAKKKQNGK